MIHLNGYKGLHDHMHRYESYPLNFLQF